MPYVCMVFGDLFFSSRRRHTRCALVTGVQRVLFRSMPTKTLVASARAAHVARRAADFGVLLEGEVRIDMAKVKSRADIVIANARRGVRDWLDGMEGCTVIEGHARFEDGNTLRVGDERMSAPQVFLNVGGRA